MTIYAVRAVMVDGGAIDLLQFFAEADAEQHADYIRQNCRLLGYDRVGVVPRRVIGLQEPLERREKKEKRKLIGAALLVTCLLFFIGCSDTPTSPQVHDVICPTGCLVPVGCYTELSPPEHPVGYRLVCPGDRGYDASKATR